MRNNYEVIGYFYNMNKLKFRKYIEIKRKGATVLANDLTVIMMNPGSSKPKDIDESSYFGYLDRFVEANPDATQYQIMAIMERCNLNYAKIINLSDVRIANSKEFYKALNDKLKNCNHSIFSESNKDELKNYLNPKSIFILAWGVNKKLTPLAQNALSVLNELFGDNLRIVGRKHFSNKYEYYHPLPRIAEKRKEWLDEIVKMINVSK